MNNYMNNGQMVSKQDLLRQIDELSFYAVDLNLYLDNHPNNQQALQDFRIVSEKLKQLENLYEKNYGALYNFGVSSPGQFNNWTWVSEDEPWPWEKNRR